MKFGLVSNNFCNEKLFGKIRFGEVEGIGRVCDLDLVPNDS